MTPRELWEVYFYLETYGGATYDWQEYDQISWNLYEVAEILGIPGTILGNAKRENQVKAAICLWLEQATPPY